MTYTDETEMPFGKHKGQKLANVPASYLLWWFDECKRDDWRDLQAYVKDNLQVLQVQAKSEKR